MRYLLTLALAAAIPSIAIAQAIPPMPTSMEGVDPLTLPKAARQGTRTGLNGFAAIRDGRCKTPIAVRDGMTSVSVPMFILISGSGRVSKIVPLNTDCPKLDTVVATEQLRMMKNNTPVPADGRPHWYRTIFDVSLEIQG
jgi:hypothetical protein